MKYAIIIPARSESSRLPNKPLLNVCGKSLIQRTYEQASKSQASNIVVATDCPKIYNHCIDNNMPVLRTGDCDSGTHRCALAYQAMWDNSLGAVVNWQVDEPLVEPDWVDILTEVAVESPWGIATLISHLNPKDKHNTNVTKTILGSNKEHTKGCTWFGRKYIVGSWAHIGIYAFRRQILKGLGKLQTSEKSREVSLEQITWLDVGYSIASLEVGKTPLSINTQEDLDKYREIIRAET